MNNAEDTAAALWGVICEEVARSMIDMLTAQGRRDGIDDAETARALLGFAETMRLEAQKMLDQLQGR